MKVVMQVQMVGPREIREVGDTVEVSASEGKRLIERGFARPARKTSKPKKKQAETPAEQREKASDQDAEDREVR